MAYVFQCDRCGNVGEKHSLTVDFFEVNEQGRKVTDEMPKIWQLCDACTERLGQVMQDVEDGTFPISNRKELAEQVRDLATDLGHRGYKPTEIATEVVELCVGKILSND
jgi:hypothetical protein